jgi:hypothetical protein
MVNQLLIGLSDFTLPEVKKLRAKQAFAKVRNSTINMQSSLLKK